MLLLLTTKAVFDGELLEYLLQTADHTWDKHLHLNDPTIIMNDSQTQYLNYLVGIFLTPLFIIWADDHRVI